MRTSIEGQEPRTTIAEQERRRALLAAHYAAENDHDLDRIMATFASGAEMIYNGQRFADPESIRWAHGYIGLSAATDGGFAPAGLPWQITSPGPLGTFIRPARMTKGSVMMSSTRP